MNLTPTLLAKLAHEHGADMSNCVDIERSLVRIKLRDLRALVLSVISMAATDEPIAPPAGVALNQADARAAIAGSLRAFQPVGSLQTLTQAQVTLMGFPRINALLPVNREWRAWLSDNGLEADSFWENQAHPNHSYVRIIARNVRLGELHAA